jgi:hypothetical protein
LVHVVRVFHDPVGVPMAAVRRQNECG